MQVGVSNIREYQETALKKAEEADKRRADLQQQVN